MIDISQKITLKAFLLAVAQLEPPIATQIEAVLPTIKQDLDLQPDRACAAIHQLVEHNEELGKLYQAARRDIRERYGSQERDQTRLPSLSVTTAWGTSPMHQALRTFSVNFAALVQWLMQEWRDEPQDFFWSLFKRRVAIATGRARLLDYAVLSAIEQNLLTTEDLAHQLKLPIEQTEHLVYRLWQEGKLDRMDGGIWHKIFPFFPTSKRPNRDSFLTLTSSGHFRIHPVLRWDRLGA